MKNKFLLTLLIGLSVSTVGLAQRKAPGYMGKRTVLKYDQGISWDFASGHGSPVPFLFHTLQFDRAISKKTSVGMEYSFMYRKHKNVTVQQYYDNYNNNIREEHVFKLNKSFLHKAGVYMKMFSQRNGHISPAGPYMTIGINFHIQQAHYSATQRNYDGSSGNLMNVSSKNYNRIFFDFAPHFGGGKQYIVSNKFVLDVSMRVSVPTIGLFVGVIGGGPINGDYMYDKPDKTGRAAVRYHAMMINSCANLIEIRLGFGGLLK